MLYHVVMGDTGPYQFSVQLLKKYTGRENDKGTNTPVFYILKINMKWTPENFAKFKITFC